MLLSTEAVLEAHRLGKLVADIATGAVVVDCLSTGAMARTAPAPSAYPSATGLLSGRTPSGGMTSPAASRSCETVCVPMFALSVIQALTQHAEGCLCELLRKAHSIPIHGRRLIVMARDIKLARALSKSGLEFIS